MIEITKKPTYTLLTLRHGKVNAMDFALLEALESALDGEENPVILTGQGRIFSAGVDLYQLTEGGTDYIRKFIPKLTQTFLKYYQFGRPVISAINGHAVAGGCILACCSDFRLMAEGAGKIGAVELKVGVAYPVAALELLRSRVNPSALNDVVFVANTYDEKKALQIGLVDEIVTADNLLPRAIAVAEELGRIPVRSYQMSKRQLQAPTLKRIADWSPHWDKEALAVWEDPETLTTIRSYLDRTLKK